MPFSILEKACSSSRSTIILSKLGRYPSLVQHYLSPLLRPLGDETDNPSWFESRDSKSIYLWIEPPFETILPSNCRNLVLTSHLDLKWDPWTTDVVALENEQPNFSGFVHDTRGITERCVPETQHPYSVPEDSQQVTLVLPDDEGHAAYLRILTFCDVWKSRLWSLSWSLSLKRKLARHLKTSHDKAKRIQPSTRYPEWLC